VSTTACRRVLRGIMSTSLREDVAPDRQLRCAVRSLRNETNVTIGQG
jgi:hypothetical protein